MLAATQEEIDRVTSYFESQAADLTVEFVQKVCTENILGHCHEVWDVHTDKDRWWVITNPSNLYAQEQFPNMDLALTFHVGLASAYHAATSAGCLIFPSSHSPGATDTCPRLPTL
jgi:hypothetical protein